MFGGFITFMIFRSHMRNPYQIAILCGVPTLGIALNYFFAKRSLAKLQGLPAPTWRSGESLNDSRSGASSGARNSSESTSAVPQPTSADQALLRTSRPRQVRMAQRGKFSIAVIILVVLAFATPITLHLYAVWARTLSFATFAQKDWLSVGFAALILLIPFGFWRSQVRECDLLENGEIAIARVVRQWSDKDNASIEYEFKDFTGELQRQMGNDTTRKLYEGMTVPVFYDRENPKRQIPYCATLHEVVT